MFAEYSFFNLMLGCALMHLFYYVLFDILRKFYTFVTNCYQSINNSYIRATRIMNKFEYVLYQVDNLTKNANNMNDCNSEQINHYLKKIDLNILIQTILSFGSYFMNWLTLYKSFKQQSHINIPNIDYGNAHAYKNIEIPSCMCPCEDFKFQDKHDYERPTGINCRNLKDEKLPSLNEILANDSFNFPKPITKKNTVLQTLSDNIFSNFTSENLRTYGLPMALKAFELYRIKKMDDMQKPTQKTEIKDQEIKIINPMPKDVNNQPFINNSFKYFEPKKTTHRETEPEPGTKPGPEPQPGPGPEKKPEHVESYNFNQKKTFEQNNKKDNLTVQNPLELYPNCVLQLPIDPIVNTQLDDFRAGVSAALTTAIKNAAVTASVKNTAVSQTPVVKNSAVTQTPVVKNSAVSVSH